VKPLCVCKSAGCFWVMDARVHLKTAHTSCYFSTSGGSVVHLCSAELCVKETSAHVYTTALPYLQLSDEAAHTHTRERVSGIHCAHEADGSQRESFTENTLGVCDALRKRGLYSSSGMLINNTRSHTHTHTHTQCCLTSWRELSII